MVKDTTIQKMLNRIKNLEKRVDELEKVKNEDLSPKQPILPNEIIFTMGFYPIGTVIPARTPPEIGEWKEIACCVWRRDK